MVKYKVVSRIVADKDCFKNRESHYYKERQEYFQNLLDKYGFICYKIIAGLYIFYITPEVYEQGVLEGLIENIDGNRIKDFHIENMFLSRGQVVNHRMWYALEHSDIEYLRSELERVNQELGILSIKVYKTSWYDYDKEVRREEPLLDLVRIVKIDLEKMQLLENKYIDNDGDEFLTQTMFKRVDDYEGVLDTLVDYQDREFMNSRHIIDKFVDSDFYDVDYWMQRLYKFEFSFEK